MSQISNGRPGADTQAGAGIGASSSERGRQAGSGGTGESSYGRPGASYGASSRRDTLHLPSGPQGRSELSGMERWGRLLGGGLLVRWGLRHGGVTGLIGVAVGGAMAWAGANGRMPSNTGEIRRDGRGPARFDEHRTDDRRDLTPPPASNAGPSTVSTGVKSDDAAASSSPAKSSGGETGPNAGALGLGKDSAPGTAGQGGSTSADGGPEKTGPSGPGNGGKLPM